MQYVIVGLGNPGAEYAGTRHSVGRDLLARIAKRFGAAEWKENKSAGALVAKGEVGVSKNSKKKSEATFVLPELFMNNSGKVVAKFVKSVKAAERLVVLYDDLDLPLGSMKISFGRGSGGHRGIESVMRALKTRDFIRVRIGIAPATPSGKVRKPSGEKAIVDFLMGKFRKPEEEKILKTGKRAGDVIKTIVAEGLARAMSEHN